MNLREMQLDIHENAVTKGFWEVEMKELEPLAWLMCCIAKLADLAEKWRKSNESRYYLEILEVTERLDAAGYMLLPRDIDDDSVALLARLCLICTEVAEAAEATDKAGLAEELADIVIRCMDLAGGYNIDLQSAVEKKMEKNAKRPYLHGKRC